MAELRVSQLSVQVEYLTAGDNARSSAESVTLEDYATGLRECRIVLTNSIGITDTVTVLVSNRFAEVLAFSDRVDAGYSGSVTLADTLGAVDIVQALRVYRQVLAESVTLAAVSSPRVAILVNDLLSLAGALSAAGAWSLSLTDLLGLSESTAPTLDFHLLDSLGATDLGTLLFLLSCVAADSVTAADTATSRLTANALALSVVTAGDTVNANATLLNLLADGFDLALKLTLDGTVWQTWSFTTEALYPSLYTGFEFNSYATLDGVTYAAQGDTIYQLTGDSDAGAGFPTGLTVRLSDLGSNQKKNFMNCYLGSSNGVPTLRVVTEQGEQYYEMANGRAKMGRGVQARTWEFSLEPTGAVNFIELQHVTMRRS